MQMEVRKITFDEKLLKILYKSQVFDFEQKSWQNKSKKVAYTIVCQ